MSELDKHMTFLSYQSKVRHSDLDRDEIIEACNKVIAILKNEREEVS